MKLALIVVFVFIALVIVMLLIGRILPVKHTASQMRVFLSSPDDVWRVVTNIDEWKAWKKGTKEVTKSGEFTFREKTSSDEIEYQVSNSVPGTSFSTTIITKDLPYGGSWNYVFEKEGSGCKLTITENGEVYNPLFRFLSKFVFGHEGTLNGYMESLSRRIQ